MSIYSDHTEYLINITWRNFVKLIPVINTVNIYNYPTCLTYKSYFIVELVGQLNLISHLMPLLARLNNHLCLVYVTVV